MTPIKKKMTLLLSEEIVESNNVAIEFIDIYSKVSDIIERTNKSMGKVITYKTESTVTSNFKINSNAFAPTH